MLAYSTPEDDLPPGVLWQTRLWLEEFTRDDHNPWQAGNTSALWRILSLTEESARYPGQKDTERAYSLIASAEGADGLLLSATLLFDEEVGTVSRVIDFFQGGDLGDDPAQISDFSQLEDLSLSGFGPALLFFFEGDKVSQTTLTNMFDRGLRAGLIYAKSSCQHPHILAVLSIPAGEHCTKYREDNSCVPEPNKL